MNWADVLVIAVILGFALLGYKNGFILSIFRILSYAISAYLAIKLYPVVSDILVKTTLYTNVKTSIQDKLTAKLTEVAGNNGLSTNSALDILNMPDFIKGFMGKNNDLAKIMDLQGILSNNSGDLAKIIMNIISVVILFILIRILMALAKVVLKKVSDLPVFKQVNKIGGLAFGMIEGLLIIYIVFAVLTLFNTVFQNTEIIVSIKESLLASFFYNHNFIIDAMFGK